MHEILLFVKYKPKGGQVNHYFHCSASSRRTPFLPKHILWEFHLGASFLLGILGITIIALAYPVNYSF